jgi:hypothetical protein
MKAHAIQSGTLAERLEGVLQQVWAIRQNWERPESFLEARSEAIGSLKSLIAEAGQLQNGAPAVTSKARAALRLLQAPDTLPSPTPVTELPESAAAVSALEPELPTATADQTEAPAETSACPPALMEAPAPVLPVPIAELAAAPAVDPSAFQSALNATALASIVADASETAQTAREAAAALKDVLTVLTALPVTSPAPVRAEPIAPPVDTSPETFYRRSDLQTPKGLAICASLWADGVSRSDIARAFGYGDFAGASCVAVALTQFLQIHCLPAETVTLTGETGKELVRRVLSRIGFKPAQRLHLSAAVSTAPLPLNGSANAVEAAAMDADTGLSQWAPDAPLPAEPAAPATCLLHDGSRITRPYRGASRNRAPGSAGLKSGEFTPSDLRTDAGRARAAELWFSGYDQKSISQHFGYAKHGVAYVSIGIGEFITKFARSGSASAIGEQRKLRIPDALQRYYAATSATQPSAGDQHAAER